MQQKTLKAPITFPGIGVHSGASARVHLLPAPENTGIVLRDVNDEMKTIQVGTVVPQVAMHATVLIHDGWKLSTIEHVMAAVGMMEVDNVIIEFEGDEFPILDGSALPFAQKIAYIGLHKQSAKRTFLTPREKLSFKDEKGREIVITPAVCDAKSNEYDTSLTLEYTAEFDHPLIGVQKFQAAINPKTFLKEIAPARTFGFLFQLPYLRQHGLAQGTTLGNTVVMGDEELLNDTRYKDEFVRHKVLDLLGDLTLLGKPLAGTIVAHKTGHSFNRVVVEHFVQNPDAWIEI